MLDTQPHALFLCNKTENALKPWADAGVHCISVDTDCDPKTEENITWVNCDVRDYLPPPRLYVFACAFPPCTHTAISGSRWFRDKGLYALKESIDIFTVSEKLCIWTEAPYFVEHPVSIISSYKGKPDYTFHPYHYAKIHKFDNYSKKKHVCGQETVLSCLRGR